MGGFTKFGCSTSTSPIEIPIPDEGTVWVVRGDTADIIGRNKAFVYNGRDANDPGKPFLTLHPGDRYNLATRRVVSRAIDATPLKQKFVDGLFAPYRDASRGGATVLVAQQGKVLVDAAYGIPLQRRLLPETGVPNVPLLGLSKVLDVALLPDSSGRIGSASVRRAATIGGMQRVTYDSVSKSWSGNVDDLYRFEQGVSAISLGLREAATIVPGFVTDTVNGMRRHSAFGTSDGRRAAWIRYPEQRTTIIILTKDDAFDARGVAGRIAEKLFGK